MILGDLVKKGLLEKSTTTSEEIEGSLDTSKRFLERVKGNYEIGFHDVAFLLAYTSMFHAARALLFKSGYKERSHYALIAAAKHIYKRNADLVAVLDTLDQYRLIRHSIQYNGSLSTELDASEAIKGRRKVPEVGERSHQVIL